MGESASFYSDGEKGLRPWCRWKTWLSWKNWRTRQTSGRPEKHSIKKRGHFAWPIYRIKTWDLKNMEYEVILSRAAEKNLDRISLKVRVRILNVLEDLRSNPQPPGCTKN